jgi:hypothetical protein
VRSRRRERASGDREVAYSGPAVSSAANRIIRGKRRRGKKTPACEARRRAFDRFAARGCRADEFRRGSRLRRGDPCSRTGFRTQPPVPRRES